MPHDEPAKSNPRWADIETITAKEVAQLVNAHFQSDAIDLLQGTRHDKRWIGMDGRYVYLLPADQSESTRLSLEHQIMEELHAASCPVPKILYSSPILQIREQVVGATLYESEKLVFRSEIVPENRYDPNLRISDRGERLARDLGHAIATCHKTFEGREGELEQQGLEHFQFNGENLAQRLEPHLNESQRSQLDNVISRYKKYAQVNVVCHGDLHHHNLCTETATGALTGIFDFGGCCLANRELDFKFLLANGRRFLQICVETYESRVGKRLDQRSIIDHHILEAAENLSYALANPHHGIDRCRGWLFSALDCLI
jgi:aminoglycoside phosphotransferase (APT) family kinase protein